MFSTQIKGKIKRERAKTPKFRACGGLKGHYNSLIQSFSVIAVLFLFVFYRRFAANNFGVIFFYLLSKVKKNCQALIASWQSSPWLGRMQLKSLFASHGGEAKNEQSTWKKLSFEKKVEFWKNVKFRKMLIFWQKYHLFNVSLFPYVFSHHSYARVRMLAHHATVGSRTTVGLPEENSTNLFVQET